MAPSLVQSKSGTTSGSPGVGLTITLTCGTTAGNCLIVKVSIEGASGDGHVSTITLGGAAGNFAKDVSLDAGFCDVEIWSDFNCTGAQASVVITSTGGSGTQALSAMVEEWSGLVSGASAFDKSSTGSNAGSSSWNSGTTATLSQSSEVAVGVIACTETITITGPSSPWTNLTVIVNGTTSRTLTGWNVVSATTGLAYNGTLSGSGQWTALIATYKAALPTTTSGGVTLKPALSGSALVGNTATGAMTLAPSLAGTSIQAAPFPLTPLGVKIELLINGTWTDVTGYFYQRADMVITTGRPDESQQLQQSSCTFVLNNRDFRFSPYFTSGAYSPFLTRNTQCRVSVAAASAQGVVYAGYRFWGEIPAWPPGWNASETDVYVTVTASGIMRRLTANTRNIGSALYRYYSRLSGAAAPVAYWPCTDASTATSFASAVSGGTAMTWTGTPSLNSDSSIAGSDGFAQYSGSSWTGSVSGGGPLPSPATYSTPGTYLWDCPGDVTTVTSAEGWGAGGGSGGGPLTSGFGGGGAGAYAKATSITVTPGTQYTVIVGTGGAPGTNSSDGGDGTDSSFNVGGVVMLAKAGTATVAGTPGQGGDPAACIGSTTHGGGDGGTALGTAGAGGGGSAGTGSAGNNGGNSSGATPGSGGSAVSGGSKGGDGAAPGASGGPTPGFGAGAGGGGSSSTVGENGGPGRVKLTYTTAGAPAANVMTFCLDVPSAGGVNGAIYGEMLTSGTIATVDVTYGTGGTLTVTGYNNSHVSKFTHTSGNICNGVPMAVRVTLTQSGSSVAWSFDYITPGGSATNISSGTVASSTVGGALAFNGNPGGTETGSVGVGEVVIAYAVDPLANLSQPLAAFAGERAATRLSRLCAEAGVGFELTGSASDTAQMGPQSDAPIVQLFQECEDADKGLLYEPRDMFGLGYRTRVSLQNQSPGVTIDYNAFQVGEAVPQPVDDELLIVNDITLTRPTGSSYEATLMSGALSVLDPPNGVGYYSQQFTYNLFADSQLANAATWALSTGTVDEFRWPVIETDLINPRNAGTNFSAVPKVAIGDFLELTNPPAFVQSGAVKQLVYGYTETLNARAWKFDFNCVPESPYEGAGLPTW